MVVIIIVIVFEKFFSFCGNEDVVIFLDALLRKMGLLNMNG
jgi:hypothetical protein